MSCMLSCCHALSCYLAIMLSCLHISDWAHVNSAKEVLERLLVENDAKQLDSIEFGHCRYWDARALQSLRGFFSASLL